VLKEGICGMTKIFHLDVKKAMDALKGGEVTVAVFGLGYVGLPLAVAWALAGAKVVGVTKDKEHLELIRNGKVPFPEEEAELQSHLQELASAGKIEVYDDNYKVSSISDVKIITVPVPLRNKKPDFSNMKDVCDAIGSELRYGDVVIVESSVPPLTTKGVIRPLLEEKSKMKCGIDFGLAYSPERVYVGRALEDIVSSYPKIVGADDEKSRLIVSGLYSTIARKGVIEFDNTLEAELEKLFEGVYRDVNIALANELARLSEKVGASYSKVREAANSQPYCNLHLPGIGVGGSCIPLYSAYLIDSSKKFSAKLDLVSLARRINQNRPSEIVKMLLGETEKLGIDPSDSEVFVMGLAFRQDVGDIRNAPSLDLIKQLRKRFRGIRVYDPLVKVKPKISGVRLVGGIAEGLEGVNVMIITVGHNVFKNYRLKDLASKMNTPFIIIDGPGVFRNDTTEVKGRGTYIALGEPYLRLSEGGR
jgi:nucleotide sugar dehydrogenase